MPHALASGRRCWVHAAWTCIILAVCLFVFWAFWSYRLLHLACPALYAVGALLEREDLHAAVVSLFLLLLVAFALAPRSPPGGLAESP